MDINGNNDLQRENDAEGKYMLQVKSFFKKLRKTKHFDFSSFWRQVKKWSVITLGYLILLLFFIPLVIGSVEAFQNEFYMKWVTLGITITAFCLTVFLIAGKKSGWNAVRIPILAFVLMVVYSAMCYPTADPKAFTFLKRPTEALLNPVFLIVILAVIAALWIKKTLPLWLRIVITTVLAYCTSAFVYGIFLDIGLEESFLGTDFFGYIPYFFLQPTYVAIQVIFPGILILSIVVSIIRRKTHPVAANVFQGWRCSY